MFHKPLKVKSQTTTKGSDRKKLRADIQQQYNVLSEEQINELIPQKDEMSTIKIETHAHDSVIVYTVQKNPMFFQIDKAIYPTVYLLWKFPDMTLTFTTWPEVLKKLQGGADLMLPGIILPTEPTSLGNFPRDHCCSIRLHGNKAPVAVGKTAISSTEMLASGMKGKGVLVLHTYKDHLWEFGDRSELPDPVEKVSSQSDERILSYGPNDERVSSAEEITGSSDNVVALNEQFKRMLHSEVEHLDLGHPTGEAVHVEEDGQRNRPNEHLETECGADNTCSMSAEEMMDDLLHKCFLYALRTNAKRVELPLLTSTFFRNHMVPCCPKERVLDAKKSSYKKLSRFLAAKQQEGFLNVKELSKGVESIVDINYDHDELRSFKIPSWSLNQPEVVEDEEPSAGTNYEPPSIRDVFIVTAAMQPLMSLFGKGKGSAMTAQEIRQHLTEYVKANNLQDPKNKRLVHLNDLLSQVLLHKNEFADVLQFDDLCPRCLENMTAAYEITFPGKDSQIIKGQLKLITLDIKQRGSNKKVTTIDNLETFGISAMEFASAVQKGVACSASVTEVEGGNKRGNNQVIVQGNQIRFIETLLRDNYRLPLKYVSGLEKAPKKK